MDTLFAFMLMVFSLFMVYWAWNNPSPETYYNKPECIEKILKPVWNGKAFQDVWVCSKYTH